jgi:hypothetical protein
MLQLGLNVGEEPNTLRLPVLEMGMVPRRGLEPPRLAAQVPETCASTNSAIWAARVHVSGAPVAVNRLFSKSHGRRKMGLSARSGRWRKVVELGNFPHVMGAAGTWIKLPGRQAFVTRNP